MSHPTRIQSLAVHRVWIVEHPVSKTLAKITVFRWPNGVHVKLLFFPDREKYLVCLQKTRHVKPMPIQCWTDVSDVGPTLNRHWFNVSCFVCSVYPQNSLSILGKGVGWVSRHICLTSSKSLVVQTCNVVQSQKAVTADLKSKQLPPFGFARQCTL